MLSGRIGEELDCVVSGLTGFGVFVQSRKFGIDGLIRMEELGDDAWKFDQRRQCVLGLRSGHSIRLGQAMKVRITSVNIPARQLNVTPAEPLVVPAAAKRQAKHGGKRGGAGRKPKRKGPARKRSGRRR
jgi:ribonuclease R